MEWAKRETTNRQNVRKQRLWIDMKSSSRRFSIGAWLPEEGIEIRNPYTFDQLWITIFQKIKWLGIKELDAKWRSDDLYETTVF